MTVTEERAEDIHSAYGDLALLEAARGHIQEATELAGRALHTGRGLGLARAATGFIHWLKGESARARESVADADHPQPATELLAYSLVLARVHLSTGDLSRAREALAAPGPGSAAAPAPLRSLHLITWAELRLAEDRPAEALRLLTKAVHEGGAHAGRAYAVIARAHLRAGSPARALRAVENLHRLGAAAGPWAQIEAWLAEALIADLLGREGTVAVALAEALSAAGGHIVQPFADAGPAVAALFARHPHLTAAHRPLADTLRLPVEPLALPLPEHITEREATVLRYLPTLLTVIDIAQELSLSVNTIKTHVRGIYRKLNVRTRRDAVRRARELGLLQH